MAQDKCDVVGIEELGCDVGWLAENRACGDGAVL
jgi:hypothetical protein